jgi:hypothetical protein
MKNPYKTILKSLGLPYKTILGESSAKTVKGQSIGYLTGIVYLVPDETICPLAKLAGCFDGCLNSAGRGAFNSVQKARKAKTEFFYQNLKVEAQKGLTLIWPAYFTHIHRGIPNTTGTKTIITGWFEYI